MGKFTKGPWEMNDDAEIVSQGVVIGMVHQAEDFPCADEEDNDSLVTECEANARLIVAAPALFDVVERLCYALAASGVEPVQKSNDPVESLFYQASELRMQIVGKDDPCEGCNKAPVDCPGWVPGLSDAEQPCRQG